MITSLYVRNVATYDNSGVAISDLKKINFFYGANGCGKTTISNLLCDNEHTNFSSCSLKWKNDQVMKTLVYNKDFKERNFGKGRIGGVFTLGEATKEEVQVIEEKTEELKLIKVAGEKKRETYNTQVSTRETLENNFKESSWVKIYKKYEPVFKEAFVGFLNKENFKNKLLLESKKEATNLLSLEELKEKALTIFGDEPRRIQNIGIIDFDRLIEIENNLIWKKIIVGKANVNISALIQKLNLNDWVNQGRSYIQEEDDTCPFCQQATITANFKKQLEDYFDETYLSDLKTVSALKLEYNSLIQNVLNQLNGVESTQEALSSSKLELGKFVAFLKTLISQSAVNSEILNNKLKEPSRSLELVSLKEQLDLLLSVIKNANQEIDKHNMIVDNFNSEKTKLVHSIWGFIVAEFRTDIIGFTSASEGLMIGIKALDTQLKETRIKYSILDLEIKNLSKNVTSVQPTIDEINRLLKSYGFLNFKIVPSSESGFYQIQREDGSIAETTLSEGEITFITFLYYLQLSKGGISKETVNDERVLVIDDPVSSLDSNVLFVVSTLIKEVIKKIKSGSGNIRQLILLTHNVYFHKEVTFIDGRTKDCSKTNFWIIRRHDHVTSVQAFLMKNPIQSSYELLWHELRGDNLKSHITIQNTMRRIIENYFKLLGKYGDDDIINKFPVKEEQEICRSLLSWINDGSHSINDDLFVELQDRTIESYKKVFKEIFISTNQEGHYNMMMGINPLVDDQSKIVLAA